MVIYAVVCAVTAEEDELWGSLPPELALVPPSPTQPATTSPQPDYIQQDLAVVRDKLMANTQQLRDLAHTAPTVELVGETWSAAYLVCGWCDIILKS